MISQELNELLKRQRLRYRILWAGMTGSAASFIVIGFTVFGKNGDDSEPLSTMLQAVNLVMALAFAVIPFLLRSLFLTDAWIRSRLEREVSLDMLARNPQTGKFDSDRLERNAAAV